MLFDLEKDIGETNDLSQEKPELVQQMSARMDELGKSTYQPDSSHPDGEDHLVWCIGDAVEYEARYGGCDQPVELWPSTLR